MAAETAILQAGSSKGETQEPYFDAWRVRLGLDEEARRDWFAFLQPDALR
jgi:hypothetical protein